MKNIEKLFNAFKVDSNLEKVFRNLDDSTWMKRSIKASLKENGLHATVRSLQEQISEGHIDKVIRTIGAEATTLLMF